MQQSSFLTWRFNVAFEFACGLHHSQTRKSTPVPYIAHLMGVCSLALDAGADEDQAIAALLHDAVEDQGGLATLETIRQLFGNRVAAAVESCSDSTVSDPTQRLPWRERKEKYLAHLPYATADALVVSAADKLHNARAILRDYRHVGDQVWTRFKASKKDQLWYYSKLVEVFKKTTAPNLLVEELERVVNDLRET